MEIAMSAESKIRVYLIAHYAFTSSWQMGVILVTVVINDSWAICSAKQSEAGQRDEERAVSVVNN